jgi:hypothetical protein
MGLRVSLGHLEKRKVSLEESSVKIIHPHRKKSSCSDT